MPAMELPELAHVQDERSSAALVGGYHEDVTESDRVTASAYPEIPDGGYGWVCVISLSVMSFWSNGVMFSWGVIQTALIDSGFSNASTLSFVGGLCNMLIVALSLFAVRFMRRFGARSSTILGISMVGLGEISSGFFLSNIGGLFGTSGVIVGSGISLIFMTQNLLPRQYFQLKLGLVNGLVRGSGGLGGTILSIASDTLIRKVGVPWTLRIIGMGALLTGIPAAYFSKELNPISTVPFVRLSMFHDAAYVAIFIAGAIGVFPLYVPPYYIPLIAQSIGLPSKTGALMTAGFNISATLGRFGAGPLCDRIGPINTLLLATTLNTITMAAIWPFSGSLPPLVTFAILNGIANGAFFTSFPTVVASIVDVQEGAVAMSMAMTGWSAGYLLGPPIAGYLLQPFVGLSSPITAFRSAIWYSAAVSLAAAIATSLAKLKRSRKLLKKL